MRDTKANETTAAAKCYCCGCTKQGEDIDGTQCWFTADEKKKKVMAQLDFAAQCDRLAARVTERQAQYSWMALNARHEARMNGWNGVAA